MCVSLLTQPPIDGALLICEKVGCQKEVNTKFLIFVNIGLTFLHVLDIDFQNENVINLWKLGTLNYS
jgi:hypothetical protein